MSAELNVQLRLLMDKLQEDAAKAAAIVKKQMGDALSGDTRTRSQRVADAKALNRIEEDNAKKVAKIRIDAARASATIESQRAKELSAKRRIENLSKPPVIKPESNDEEGGGQSMAQGMYRMVMSYIRFKVFSYAVDKLRHAIEAFTKAIKDAHARYAEAATSGFGIGTFTKRQGIAKILGVDANEVYRFGGAFAFLNNRMKDSFNTIASGTRPLAELNMSWEMMKVDMEALFVKLAVDAKPALEGFILWLDELINLLKEGTGVMSMYGKVKFVQPLYWVAKLGQLLGGDTDTFKNAGLSKGIPALNPQMKQLPASSWERMGLVIGGGATRNYQQETAKNTGEMSKKLSQLLKAMGAYRGHGAGGSWEAVPSTP